VSGALGPVRLVVLAIGLTAFVVGLALVLFAGAVGGIELIVLGALFVVVAFFERIRYRSDTADRAGEPTGPAGGEPAGTRLEARFSRTDEVFTDPTTGRRMRVWIDSASGERRYVAEQ
jgi:hypothetical protein